MTLLFQSVAAEGILKCTPKPRCRQLLQAAFEIESPTASRRGAGRHCPPLHPTKWSGERCKLFQRLAAGSEAESLPKWILCLFEVRRSHLGHLLSVGQSQLKSRCSKSTTPKDMLRGSSKLTSFSAATPVANWRTISAAHDYSSL